MQQTLLRFLGWEDPLEKGWATHSSILGLPLWLSWQRIRLQRRRPVFDPWVGKIPWRGNGRPLQYSGLENSMDYCPCGRKELGTTEWFSLSPSGNILDLYGYIYYLKCDDGFTKIYICQNLSNCKLHVLFIVCQLYLHKALFKKILKKLTAIVYLELGMLGCFSGCMYVCVYVCMFLFYSE